MASPSGFSQSSVSATSVGKGIRSGGSTSDGSLGPARPGYEWVQVANSNADGDEEIWEEMKIRGPEYSESGADLPPPPSGWHWTRIYHTYDPDRKWQLVRTRNDVDIQGRNGLKQAILSAVRPVFRPRNVPPPLATGRSSRQTGKRSGGIHGLFRIMKEAMDESRVVPAPPPRRRNAYRQRSTYDNGGYPRPPPPPFSSYPPPPPPGAIPVDSYQPSQQVPFGHVPDAFGPADEAASAGSEGNGKKKGKKGKGKAAGNATAPKEETSYTLAEVKPPDNYRDIPPIKLQKPVKLDEAGTLHPAFALVSRDRDKAYYVTTDDKLVTIQRHKKAEAQRLGIPEEQKITEDLWTKRTKRDQVVSLPESLKMRLDGRDYRLTVNPSTGAVRPVGFPYHFIPHVDERGNFRDRKWEVVPPPPPPTKTPKKGKKTTLVQGPGDPWPAEGQQGPWPDVDVAAPVAAPIDDDVFKGMRLDEFTRLK